VIRDLSEIVFKSMDSADEAILKEMLFECIYLPEVEKKNLSKEILEHPDLKKYYTGWGREEDIAIVAYIEAVGIIGCAWGRLFNLEQKGYGFIHEDIPEISIALNSRYRNKGIGTRLLKKLIKAYSEINVHR
jgi:GNAT superfamily N-acetyltransferase